MEVKTSGFLPIKTHFYKYRYFYLVLAAVSSIYVFPLLFVQMPTGHDVWFHMTRIDGLAGELELGNLPARIYSTVYYDFGYAAPLFYGDWLLYFPAFLVVNGVSVVVAYKTFIMSCAVLTALSMYFSAQIILKDKKAACVTAVLYSLSTYLATDAFVRHANGEMQSFIFIPIALAGLYDIIRGEGKRWLLLPLGLCGVLVTHTLTAFMTVVFLALFALMFLTEFIEKPKKLLYIAASAVVFFLLSASFIFPMIEQLSSNKFWATDGTSADYFGTLKTRSMQSIYSLFSTFNSTSEVDGQKYFIPQGVGLVFPVLIGWRIAYFKKTRSADGAVFLTLAIFSLILTSRFFPWGDFQSELGTLQFPWRIMLFATVFIALFGGVMTKKLNATRNISIFLSIITVVAFYSVTNTLYYKYKDVYVLASNGEEKIYNYTNNIGLGEYLPSGTVKTQLLNNGRIVRSSSYINKSYPERIDGVFTMYFDDNRGDDTYIDVPLLMYKGYRATLETDKITKELPVTYGNNNVVRVYIGDADSGTLRVWYDGTPIQKWSFAVTILSFGGVLAYYIILYKKRKKEGEAIPPLTDISELINK
ncbi:MAG: hypothetical protein CVU97_01730 [Firmicutes bacterium HGW-Firmicutes-21]|nr:MAG: hypothetical protein CVU97_01730 [Firmicutes bacterium HGW-Firmicutes-21]